MVPIYRVSQLMTLEDSIHQDPLPNTCLPLHFYSYIYTTYLLTSIHIPIYIHHQRKYTYLLNLHLLKYKMHISTTPTPIYTWLPPEL